MTYTPPHPWTREVAQQRDYPEARTATAVLELCPPGDPDAVGPLEYTDHAAEALDLDIEERTALLTTFERAGLLSLETVETVAS